MLDRTTFIRPGTADRDLHRGPRERLPRLRRVFPRRRADSSRGACRPPASASPAAGRHPPRRRHPHAAAVPCRAGDRGAAAAPRSGKALCIGCVMPPTAANYAL